MQNAAENHPMYFENGWGRIYKIKERIFIYTRSFIFIKQKS